MAFEYLLVNCLVNRDVPKLMDQLGRLDDFGYPAIPRHCEEAILLHQKLTGAQVDLRGREIRPETLQRFEQFWDAIRRRTQETEEGRAALTRDFGDTFWRYYYARPVPAGQGTG